MFKTKKRSFYNNQPHIYFEQLISVILPYDMTERRSEVIQKKKKKDFHSNFVYSSNVTHLFFMSAMSFVKMIMAWTDSLDLNNFPMYLSTLLAPNKVFQNVKWEWWISFG